MKVVAVVLYLILALGVGVLFGCTSQPTVSPGNGSPSATVVDQTVPGEQIATTATPGVSNTLTLTDIPTIESVPTNEDSESATPIRVLTADEVKTLEPYRIINLVPDDSIASHIWDTLTWLNDDLQVEPRLAESWRIVNNFTWEFTLRHGIIFHNGEPLNAEAVRFSIERSRSMPGSLETFARDINLETIELVDDYTLRITTAQPIVNLPYYLAFLEILPPVYYAETDPDRLAVAPVGSGPYRLEAWKPGEPLVLTANTDYWQGPPVFSSLIFESIPQAEERLAALRAKQATLIADLPPLLKDQLAAPEGRLEAIESTQRLFVGINVKGEGPLANKQVRQALNYAVNVPPIVDNLLAGYGQRYGSWVNPPNNNPDLAPWPYDPTLAQELLAQAGYREGFTTTLQVPQGVYNHDIEIAQTISQQLAEIGIIVEVRVVDWATYIRQLLSDDPPPLFLLALNSRGDGLEDLKNLSINFAFNRTGWQNETFEGLLLQATNAFNESARTSLLNEAQAIPYDEAPWIWLWRPYKFYGVSQSLDWTPRRDGLIYLYKTTNVSSH